MPSGALDGLLTPAEICRSQLTRWPTGLHPDEASTRATGGKRRLRPRTRLVENVYETFRDRLMNLRPVSSLIPGIESFAAGGLASLTITAGPKGAGDDDGSE